MEPLLPGLKAMTRCEQYHQGVRRPDRRARLAEKNGWTARVLGVPVEACDACGQIWLRMLVAKRLDEILAQLLASGAESAETHWDSADTA